METKKTEASEHSNDIEGFGLVGAGGSVVDVLPLSMASFSMSL